jgi:hypothetical protein
MPITKYLLLGAMTLGLISGVVACAARSHGVVQVPRDYDEVFVASVTAIQEAEFTVTSQEHDTGTIAAEKHLPSTEGDSLQMTIRLTQVPAGVTVVATVVPPTGLLATGEKPCKCHVKRFVSALEHQIPEVQLETIK